MPSRSERALASEPLAGRRGRPLGPSRGERAARACTARAPPDSPARRRYPARSPPCVPAPSARPKPPTTRSRRPNSARPADSRPRDRSYRLPATARPPCLPTGWAAPSPSLRRIAEEAIRLGEAAHDDAVVRHGLWAISWTYALVGQFAEERRILERLIGHRPTGRPSRVCRREPRDHRQPPPVRAVDRCRRRSPMSRPCSPRSHALCRPAATVLQSLGMSRGPPRRAGRAQGRAHIAEAKTRSPTSSGLLVPAGSSRLGDGHRHLGAAGR